jgi:hypothetical protein
MGWCLCAGVWLVGTLVLLRGVEPAPGAEGGVSPVFYGAIVVCFAAVGLGLVLLTRLRGPLAYRRAPVMVIATLTVGLTAGICAIVLHARPLLAGPELAPQDEAPRAAAPVRAPRRPTQPALSPGLRYKYYHSAGGKVPDFKDMEPVKQGIVESFTLEPAERDDNFAMIFEGMLKVPAEGKYRFHLGSDDGSHLYLDDSHVIDNDGAHGLVFKTATETLEDKPVAIKVTYAQGGGGARLSVRWEGPELNRQSIAGKYLAHTN